MDRELGPILCEYYSTTDSKVKYIFEEHLQLWRYRDARAAKSPPDVISKMQSNAVRTYLAALIFSIEAHRAQ
jgi:hypothetical protein